MTRRLVAWSTGWLYLHPAKRARQLGRVWGGATVLLVAAFLIALRLAPEWAWLLGWAPLTALLAIERHAWADGWEARDRRGRR